MDWSNFALICGGWITKQFFSGRKSRPQKLVHREGYPFIYAVGSFEGWVDVGIKNDFINHIKRGVKGTRVLIQSIEKVISGLSCVLMCITSRNALYGVTFVGKRLRRTPSRSGHRKLGPAGRG